MRKPEILGEGFQSIDIAKRLLQRCLKEGALVGSALLSFLSAFLLLQIICFHIAQHLEFNLLILFISTLVHITND